MSRPPPTHRDNALPWSRSAILDNLTTTIVMVSLMRKLIDRPEDRLMFAGIVVIAANAGGAWSPIGDVTTTMLWIGGQITSVATIQALLFPSLACMLVPVAVAAYGVRGRTATRPAGDLAGAVTTSAFER